MAGLRSLSPESRAGILHEIQVAEDELRYLRDRRAGLRSMLGKVEGSIGANEAAVVRLRRMLDEATT